MSILDKETVENIKTEVTKEVETTLKALEKGYPGITEGLATAIGSGTGAAGSLVTLSAIGKVAGLSAPGITSGLAAAGALVGGRYRCLGRSSRCSRSNWLCCRQETT